MKKILFLLFCKSLFCQDFYYLLDYTLKKSPIINMAKIDIQSAIFNYDFYKSYLYPEVYISADYKFSNTKSNEYKNELFNEYNNHQNTVSVILKYDIFKFGSDYYKMQSSKENIKSLTYTKCKQELKISLELLDYYKQALLIKNRINIYKKLKLAYEALYNYSIRLNEIGEIDKLDVNSYFLELNNIQAQLIKFEFDLNDILLYISYLSSLSVDDVENFSNIDEELITFLSFEKSNQYFEIQSKIKENEYILKSLKSQKYPTFTLYARYDFYDKSKYYYEHFINSSTKHGYIVGLNFTYYIYDAKKLDSQIQLKKLEIKKSNEELSLARLEYNKQINELIFFIKNKDKILSTLELIDKESKIASEYVNKLNSSGEKTKIDVLNMSVDNLKKILDLNEYIININANKIKIKLINTQNKLC